MRRAEFVHQTCMRVSATEPIETADDRESLVEHVRRLANVIHEREPFDEEADDPKLDDAADAANFRTLGLLEAADEVVRAIDALTAFKVDRVGDTPDIAAAFERLHGAKVRLANRRGMFR